MTPAALAALHARCFAAHPRPWSATEIEGLLDSPPNFLIDLPQGFLIGRAVADEAELLTLAVAPETRRQGLARALLAGFYARSRERGAGRAFLEVASDNPAALTLYRSEGWAEAGLRRGYYAPGIDAILMDRAL